MRTTLWQWGEDVRGLLAEGVLCRGLDMYTETYEYALKRAEDTASVYMDAFARGSYDTPTKALVNYHEKLHGVYMPQGHNSQKYTKIRTGFP